jgi:DMSO/TMAO reductase YedYZ heme-binding membrane subunit
MSEIWWYLGRASGVVATVLIVASLVWGLFFKARATGNRRRPNWWLDLHKYLGGLAFVFTIIHVFAVYQDELSGIGLTQVLVPFTAEGWRWGITLGVVAMYVFALVVFTSWPARRGSRRTWLLIHLASIPATVLAGVHAWMVGSSRDERWFQVLLVTLVGLVVYPAVLRSFSAVAARRRRTERATRRPAAALAATSGGPRAPGAARPTARELVTSGDRS